MNKNGKNPEAVIHARTHTLCNLEERAITLIALILTIIVLLILAGVALNFVLGENGILKHAEFASNKYQNSAEKEANELAQLEDYINSKEKNEICAENVSFTPADTNWNVNNVKEALDYLYSH